MSKYTTGEVAKLCGVSVRTVQYYDTRGILVPGELSEGGRRLYSDEDLKRMRIICFLRELGLSLNGIGQLLADDDPAAVISLLLEQQAQALQGELAERQRQLELIDGLRRELKGGSPQPFSVESIGDIAHIMKSKNELRKLRLTAFLPGIPLLLLEVASIVLWIVKGMWPLFVAYLCLAIPYGIWVTRYYFRRVAYICPQCHQTFRPPFREAFWARHTPRTRRLTCPSCGRKGFCVEVYAAPEEK